MAIGCDRLRRARLAAVTREAERWEARATEATERARSLRREATAIERELNGQQALPGLVPRRRKRSGIVVEGVVDG